LLYNPQISLLETFQSRAFQISDNSFLISHIWFGALFL
jgi:hypothetical protein